MIIKDDKVHINTACVHAGVEADPTTGAIMTPIYQTSTYVQSAPGNHKGYEYSRTLNPTRHALEKSIAALEGAKFGACFGSGLAAADAIIKLLSPGDEILCGNDLYGGTYRLLTTIFKNFGIKTKFLDLSNSTELENAFTENTKMVMLETPTNPTLTILDIKKIAEITHKHKALLIVDNTFATPVLQTPIALGADIVWHSATKYLGGHSDVVLGAIATNDDSLADRIYFIQNSSGAVPGPMDSFLVLRGIKTLHLRMERVSQNALAIAEFLSKHNKVQRVHYPGLASHKNHHVAQEQMKSFGGMLSFDLIDDHAEVASKILSSTQLFTLAESLGGVESLIGHPASMTHAAIPREERIQSGVTDSLMRISVGVEYIDDLLADLSQALQ